MAPYFASCALKMEATGSYRTLIPVIKLEGFIFQKTIILVLNNIIINLRLLLAILYRFKHLIGSGLTIIHSSWNLFFEILKFHFWPEIFSHSYRLALLFLE
jgi:hypothetical protein